MQRRDFAATGNSKLIGRKVVFRRREFLSIVGGSILSSGIGRAQPSPPVVGFLYAGSASRAGPLVSAFWQGLNAAGFQENRNVAAMYAFSDGHDERLPDLSLNLLTRGASIIVTGGTASAVAARQSTARTPIVFIAASALPGSLFESDINRSEGNITGVSVAAPDLLAERLRNLLKLAPAVRSAAVLINPQTPNIDVQLGYLNDAARQHGIRTEITKASGEADFTAALRGIAQARQDALVVANDGFLNSRRGQLVALAIASQMPAAFANREFVEGGGLLSYGPSLLAAYRQAGDYAARILKGEKPADLPIANPFEMELALNTKTAKSLGLGLPLTLVAAASEVIR